MHDALGNALVVEVGDLLAQDEVFQQRGPKRMRAQRVLVVGNAQALVGGQHWVRAARGLVQFAAGTDAVKVGGMGWGRGWGCRGSGFFRGHVASKRP